MKASPWAVPALVILAAVGGIGGARLFAAPSVTRDFSASAGRPETVRFVVEGLKCVDTAERLASQLEGRPGVMRFVAYASRNEARISYDAAVTGPEALRVAMEGPVFIRDTGEILFNQYKVVSIDGRKIH
jgi:hypothetical protein